MPASACLKTGVEVIRAFRRNANLSASSVYEVARHRVLNCQQATHGSWHNKPRGSSRYHPY